MFIIIGWLPGFGQTSSETGNEIALNTPELVQPNSQHEIMIIPFEPKLYRSEIDAAIARKTGLSHKQIRERFRYGLAANLLVETGKNHRAILMNESETGLAADLQYIYKSIGYQYRLVPGEEVAERKSAAARLIGKFSKKTDEEPAEEGGIKEGQVAASTQTGERYMSTKIINPNMLDYLTAKYGTSIYVFINQLDLIGAADNDYRDYAAEDYKRIIKVHYTILNSEGKELDGGAVKYLFSSRINDMNTIIKELFADVCSLIAGHINQPDASPALKQKAAEEKEKAAKQEKELMKQY